MLLPVFIAFFAIACWAGDGFQPVSPEELKMKSEPLAPGAAAIVLYRQVDRDDNDFVRGVEFPSHQYNYVRIKILTEAGRKYADVELPYYSDSERIGRIEGRTIKPDGSIVSFDGKVFEKSLVKGRSGGLMAKTFTLPDVEPGAIIEYYYYEDFRHIYDSRWILSWSLFTKSARFSLHPYKSNSFPLNLHWNWQGLPPGATPKADSDRVIRMDANNIPAFEPEDYMPPANELMARVDFIYQTEAPEKDPAKFWEAVGKKWNEKLENFVGKRKAMEEAVAGMVSPGDSSETKLRKIYARVQEIRNKTYELSRTRQEQQRDKEKPAENVEEVWKRGYGTGIQLTWLYLGLVRAAGLDAYGCWVSSRRQYFFNPNTMQTSKLNANVVLVKAEGKEYYLDPGAEFTPFGMLTWYETGVNGLCLDKNGGTLVRTPLPQSSESRIERKASLKLSDEGDLKGTLRVTYTGLEAMYLRVGFRHADDVARKQALEDSVKAQIPATAEVELISKPDWSSTEAPLIADFNLTIAGWASNAGKRMTAPAGLFIAYEKHMFEHANRVHPIYFEYPYQKVDDIAIELAPGWQVAGLPPAQAKDGHVVSYDLKAEWNKETLHLTRKLTFDALLLDVKYYPALRNFFESVRTGDEAQILLQPGTASASK